MAEKVEGAVYRFSSCKYSLYYVSVCNVVNCDQL